MAFDFAPKVEVSINAEKKKPFWKTVELVTAVGLGAAGLLALLHGLPFAPAIVGGAITVGSDALRV